MSDLQYLRECSLLVAGETEVLDLSEMRIHFQVKAADVESPTNAWIRVYNLSQSTVERIRREYTRVVLQAGYRGNVGVIFDGTIKQFRIGRQDSMTTYFDLLCADGDIAYNNAVINRTLGAGSTVGDRIKSAVDSMRPLGINGQQVWMPQTGGVLPRGKVQWGMSRIQLRREVESMGATWSIQNGTVRVIPKKGYAPNQVVVLNGQTGLIGRPEQTVDGIRARCLINPNIQVGARVQIDNAAINQTLWEKDAKAPLVYDRWAQLQHLANISADGLYRTYVIEYEGDTRGQEWYSDLTLLAVDPSSDEVLIE